MQKRNFTRIPYESEAVIKCGDTQIKGDIENLSLNGMLLKTSEKMDVGTAVDIQILLTGTSSRLYVDLNGQVIRHADEGLGIQFTGMHLDVFLHLKHVISLGLKDEKQIMQEFLTYMKR